MRISLHNKGFGKINEGDYEKELARTEIPTDSTNTVVYTKYGHYATFSAVCFFWGFNDEHRRI